MRGKARFTSPDTLEADSESEVKLIFESQDDEAYHIRRVYFAPTWRLTNRKQSMVDKTVFPETEKIINIGQMHFPPALGGKQGFRIGFEVSPYFNEEIQYQVVWAGIVRKQVTNSMLVKSVIYNTGETAATGIQGVLDNWGFESMKSGDTEKILEYMQDSDPKCLFTTLPGGSDDTTVNSVASMVATAIDKGIWPLVFTDDQSYAEKLPQDAIVIKCDISNQYEIEKESALMLHTIRFSVEKEISSLVFDRVIDELKKTVESTTVVGKSAFRRVIEALTLDAVLEVSGANDMANDLIDSVENELSPSSEHSSEGHVDLTHLANAESQLIEIRVFYKDDPVWYNDRWYEEHQQDRNRAFSKVVEEGRLPESFGRFSIYWSKEISALTIHYSPDDMEKFYESRRIKKLKTKVPRAGTYAIVPENGVISWLSFEEPFSGAYETSSSGQVGGNISKIFEGEEGIESIIVGCPVENKTLSSSIREYILDTKSSGYYRRSWYRD